VDKGEDMRLSMGTIERVILGGLALLWAGVLPWLCWGAWGQPGHPHAAPHWVFAPPPTAPPPTALPAYVAPTPIDPAAPGHIHTHTHTHTHSHDSAPGPARPDTLLVALLLIVWPTAWVIPWPRRLSRGRRGAPLYVATVWQRIPTPPPRGMTWGCAQSMLGRASSI